MLLIAGISNTVVYVKHLSVALIAGISNTVVYAVLAVRKSIL